METNKKPVIIIHGEHYEVNISDRILRCLENDKHSRIIPTEDMDYFRSLKT